jgi:DNA polymerase (family 10)
MTPKKEKNNSKIAEIFFEMADILEFNGVKWKPQAYIAAGQTLESSKKDISEIYQKSGREGLLNLPGIGEALTDKIIQYLKEGKIEEHERLIKTLPFGLVEMMRVPSIGAKKASLLYRQLRIKNIDELARAAEEHKLLKLEGFGDKSERKILEGIELMKHEQTRIPLKRAKQLANKILKEIKKVSGVQECIAAGSLRRRKSSVKDLDIVVMAENNKQETILKKFTQMHFVKEILGVGKEKATIITKDGVQVDVRVFNEEEFGAGLLYFTGDKQHNIWLRKIAIKKGWKLNEYGLFDKKNKRIAGRTEEEVYDLLDLDYIKPEARIGEVR